MSVSMTRQRPLARQKFTWPWQDRQGRFITLRAIVFAAVLTPALVLAFWALQGSLGGRALNVSIRYLGFWTVRLLLVTLAVTPLRGMLVWPQVTGVRRMLGLATMFYALGHLSLYVVQQGYDPVKVVHEITHRIYLMVGLTALTGLVALGVTSTDAMVRRMGRAWKRLHWLIYPIGVLALLHFYMQSKADVSDPVLATGLFVWLMLFRAMPAGWQRNPAPYLGLAVLAMAGAAGLEIAWYGIATRVHVARVFAANFQVAYGLRPAVWVGVIGLGVAVVVAARRWWPPVRERLWT